MDWKNFWSIVGAMLLAFVVGMSGANLLMEPQTIEVEIPVEVPVEIEKLVEVPVEVLVEVIKEVEVEVIVEVPDNETLIVLGSVLQYLEENHDDIDIFDIDEDEDQLMDIVERIQFVSRAKSMAIEEIKDEVEDFLDDEDFIDEDDIDRVKIRDDFDDIEIDVDDWDDEEATLFVEIQLKDEDGNKYDLLIEVEVDQDDVDLVDFEEI